MQFISIQEYSRFENVKKEQFSASQVINESCRTEGFCPHVETPQKPKMIYGEHPLKMVKDLELLAENMETKQGRKLRKDARIMMAGVASYPIPMKEFDDITKDLKFRKWLKMTEEFLKRRFGGNLKSIVLHLDESCAHIHFVCHDKSENLSLKKIHPGMIEEAKEKKKTKRAKTAAFKRGLSEFQKDYHLTVSRHFGHEQFGERRERRDKAEQKAFAEQQKIEEKLQESENKDTVIERLIEQKTELINENIELKQEVSALKRALNKVKRFAAKLEDFIKFGKKRDEPPELTLG